jgi:hypothetical protein
MVDGCLGALRKERGESFFEIGCTPARLYETVRNLTRRVSEQTTEDMSTAYITTATSLGDSVSKEDG